MTRRRRIPNTAKALPRTTIAVACACSCLAGFPGGASAGNTDGILLGDDASLMAGAVTAVVNDGSALWYNPAGLKNVDRNSVNFSLTAYSLRLYRIPSAIMGGGESSDADVNEVTVVPSALSYVRTTDRGLRIGFGLFTTALEDYNQRSELSFPELTTGLESEWLITLANRIQVYHGILGVGWSVNERLHFGVTGDISYISAIQSSQIGGGLATGQAIEDALFAVTQSTRTSISAVGARVGLGVLWEPIESLTLGFSFQTASYVVFSSVSQQTVTSFSVVPLDEPGTILFETTNLSESDLGFNQAEPYRWRLGFAYHFPRGLVSFDGDVQLDQRVDSERWEVSGNARVGLLLQLADFVALGLGAFTDRATLREQPTEFGETLVDFYGFTAGVKLGKTMLLAETEQSDSIEFETTIAFRFAVGSGDFSGFEVLDDINDEEILTPVLSSVRVYELAIYLGSGIRF